MQKIKIRERMLLVYIIGGIVPILIVNSIIYRTSRDALIEQAKTAELEVLSLITDSVSESMDVVTEVSKQLYFDEDIERIAFHDYTSYSELLKDYRDFDIIPNYLNYYYREVASINVYVDNPSISNNEYFIYANAEIQKEDWYQMTLEKGGTAYWFYQYDTMKKKYSLCIARVLYTEDMEQVGILTITMQNKRTELDVTERSTDTAFVYNGARILHKNFDVEDEPGLLMLVKRHSGEDTFCQKVQYEGQDCL